MRKIKAMAFILSVLSCLSLFGVGYSAWYNINPIKPQQQTGSIVSYDVLEISNTEMTTFKFSMLSFKERNIQTDIFENVDIGTITVTYTVDTATLKATNGNFRVDTALGYDKLTVRDEYKDLFVGLLDEGGNTVSIACTPKSTSSSTTIESVKEAIEENEEGVKEIVSAYEFKNVPKSVAYSFTLTYTFNIPSADGNFASTFGKYLMGGDTEGKNVTKFIASAYVSKIS